MGNLCSGPKRKTDFASLKLKYEQAGQGHVLSNYHTLGLEQKENLLDQLSSFEPLAINKLYKNLVQN